MAIGTTRHDFRDSVVLVLVTGGGAGIGRGIVHAFIGTGAVVVATGRLNDLSELSS